MTQKEINQIVLRQSIPIIIIGKLAPDDLCAFLKITAMDLFVINSETIKIAEIREVLHFINHKPLKSQFKLVVIENADKMTTEAGNALLKTLEEPPVYAKIVLATQQIEKILPTILSRCQKVRASISEIEENVVENNLSPDKITNMNLSQSFTWAAQAVEQGNTEEIITNWQKYYRKKLIQGKDVLNILNVLSRAKDLLQSNISLKLLLENIILNMESIGEDENKN